MRAKFCPRCENADLAMIAGGTIGMLKCKKCGFSGAIFPERDIEEIKSKNKKQNKK